ncbi:hypothetical protein [Rubritalea tangerina]|uniref:TIGR04222 domain-containing membrane protein n=1 Tax=Rubritalea tangerina TaxID=430798 RepID=A0ABW4Z8P8_9BACT
MWKLVILLALAPFVGACICANLFGLKALTQPSKLSCDVDTLLNKILSVMDRTNISIHYVKRQTWPRVNQHTIELPQQYRNSKSSIHHARACLTLSYTLLYQEHQEAIDWRLKTIKTGYLLPLFTLLIVAFSFLIGKLPGIIMIASLTLSLGITSCLLWWSLRVERDAAHHMASRIEKLRVLPRLREEEALTETLKALPWASLIPGVFLKLTTKG